MADVITVDVKQAQKEIFKLRARFQKLQRIVLTEALFEASEPIVSRAQALAPRFTGLLAARILPTRAKRRGFFSNVNIGPTFSSGRSLRSQGFLGGGRDPFYGLFQERGWWLTTHTAKGAREIVAANRKLTRGERKNALTSLKASRRRIRFIPGKNFLKTAGATGFRDAESIFAARIFQRFAEIQSAGESAGIV